MRPRLGLILIFLIAFAPAFARAQNLGDDIENLFMQEENREVTEVEAKPPTEETKAEKLNLNIKELKDLANLAPFEDVAVIQKRFLPKTKRFEAFAGAGLILNDLFFLSFGFNGRLAYYFSERTGIEFVTLVTSTTQRKVTDDLATKRVRTQNFVSPKYYYGADFKMIPMYGKLTWNNRRIIPVDTYFSIGGGITSTNQSTTPPTLHLGTGQTFALSKDFAARWDFSWYAYQTKTAVTGSSTEQLFNNIYLTVGASWFFPEAGYR